MTANAPSRVRALNHWSVGAVVIGMLMSLSPSLTFMGVGISAVGVAFYAGRKRLLPIWAVLVLFPFWGAALAFVVVTAFPVREPDGKNASFRLPGFLMHPATWAMPLLIICAGIWYLMNPALTHYRTRAYDTMAQTVLKKAAIAQDAFFSEHKFYCRDAEVLKREPYNLAVYSGVELIVLSAGDEEYVMEAYHRQSRNRFRLNGPSGGIETYSSQ